MGRSMLDEGLAYERTEGVAVPGSWPWPFSEGTHQQHDCKRMPSKETHTKPMEGDMGRGRGGTNVRISDPKRSRGWGSPTLLS